MSAHPLYLRHVNHKVGEFGSALFLILIAVVLFAALTYAITQSNRGDGNSMSKEGASVEATAIIQSGTLLENSFTKMMMRSGCDPTTISFENLVVSGYTNVSTVDNCRFFDPAGGGVSYSFVPSSWLVTTKPSWWPYGQTEPLFTRQWGAGRDDSTTQLMEITHSWPATGDFLWIVAGIKKNICIQINNKLNIANPSGNPPQQKWSCNYQKYVGTNPNGCKWTIQQVEDYPLRAACVEGGTTNGGDQTGFYMYYHALWIY